MNACLRLVQNCPHVVEGAWDEYTSMNIARVISYVVRSYINCLFTISSYPLESTNFSHAYFYNRFYLGGVSLLLFIQFPLLLPHCAITRNSKLWRKIVDLGETRWLLLAGIFHLLQIARCSTGLNGLDPEQIEDRGWRLSLDAVDIWNTRLW